MRHRTTRHRRGGRVIAAVGGALAIAACASAPIRLDPQVPPVIIHLQPNRAWTDTDVVVQRGERLLLSATGEVLWGTAGFAAGPDGAGGIPGWSVGDGGLIAQVGGTKKILDVGARVTPFLDRNLRSRLTHAPPPLDMPASGTLRLGFKNFQPGANSGGFDVIVRRVS